MNESTTQAKLSTDAATFARRVGTGNSQLAGEPVRCVARAPVSLDVMGGIAELSGALTLAAPFREAVRVALAPRADRRLHIVGAPTATGGHAERNGHGGEQVRGEQVRGEQVWELSAFYDGDALVPVSAMRAKLAGVGSAVPRAILAAAHALLSDQLIPHFGGGWTVIVESECATRPDGADLAAVQGAAAAALARALGASLDAKRLSAACRRSQNELLDCPTGIMTQVGPLLGKPGELLQVSCGPFTVCDPLLLPSGVALLGIDCGARHAHADQKYATAFTTALMGREIIARLMPVVCRAPMWDGYLARVSITDFVDQLRDRIPTKLKGAQYLERFGPLAKAPTPIVPELVYKVRSRAEHHIYEDDRVRQFVERLTRARRTGDEHAIVEAGELMYASHWSYGQRCGLGSIESDLLVSLLRTAGPRQGILGARVSGTGCGGTVAVLLRDDDSAMEAVDRVIQTYEQRSKRTASLRRVAEEGTPGFIVEQFA